MLSQLTVKIYTIIDNSFNIALTNLLVLDSISTLAGI